MVAVTDSVTARADSFDEVRKLSLEHVRRSRTEETGEVVERMAVLPCEFHIAMQHKGT
jgi:hypothetical protein